MAEDQALGTAAPISLGGIAVYSRARPRLSRTARGVEELDVYIHGGDLTVTIERTAPLPRIRGKGLDFGSLSSP